MCDTFSKFMQIMTRPPTKKKTQTQPIVYLKLLASPILQNWSKQSVIFFTYLTAKTSIFLRLGTKNK